MKGKIRLVAKRGLLFALIVLLTGCGGGGGGSSDNNNDNGGGGGSAGVTISGTISAAAGTVTDSDTNDPSAIAADNNSFITAQNLPNPAVVGGFVTATPTGVPGDRFANTADVVDVFIATLSAGQTVTLTISDHPGGLAATPDLDLYLYGSNDTSAPVESVEDQTATESITVSATGDLLRGGSCGGRQVQLRAQYRAVAEQHGRGQCDPGIRARRGRGAVRRDLPARRGDRRRLLPGRPDWSAGKGRRRRAPHAVFPAGRRPGTGPGFGRPWGRQHCPEQSGFGFGSGETLLKHQTRMAVKALRGRKDVKTADLNYIFRPELVPNDPYYGYQWHYPLINLPQAWDLETGTSNAVTVAVVDTGVLLSHPDLAGVLTSGYDFISDPARANDGNGIDPDPNDPGDGQTPGGSSFHGTHVAGTIAARTNNDMGVAGISWGATIMPVRVLGIGGGTSYDIIQGVRYAAGLPNDSGTMPTKRADIINLSLSCPCRLLQPDATRMLIPRPAIKGSIIIAAAGNENTSELGYPASYDGVVSVSAVDSEKKLAPYSNFGAGIDVAAPGGDMSVDKNGDGYPDGVLSTLADDSSGTPQPIYGFYNGTSMAAAHMSGVVALMKSANPGVVTPDRLDAWLASGSITEDLAANGASVRDDSFGYGLINASSPSSRPLEGLSRFLSVSRPVPCLSVPRPLRLP